MVSNSFSVGEEGATPLTSPKRDKSLAFLSHFFWDIQRLHCHHRKSHTGLAKSPVAALALLHG